MTHYTEFEKAVRHVRDCLFWDFVDGVWNDVIVTPLDRNYFNRLMQQVSDAHAREVEALNAENDKLREQSERLFDKTLELGTENAKLRELAKILANCAAGHGCDYCPINGGHGHVDEIDMCESVHDRMHELGIEV